MRWLLGAWGRGVGPAALAAALVAVARADHDRSAAVSKTTGRPAEFRRAGATLRLAEQQRVVFSPSGDPPSEGFLVRFAGRDRLASKTPIFDAAGVHLTTAIGEVVIPMVRVAEIVRLGDPDVRVRESFDASPEASTRAGGAARTVERFHTPPAALELKSPGDKWTLDLPEPLLSGQASFWFHDEGQTVLGRRWSCALLGAESGQPLARVELGWDRPHYQAAFAEAAPSRATPLQRRTGWRELRFVVDPARWTIFVDGKVLAAAERTGSERAVGSIRFDVAGVGPDKNAATAAIVDDLLVRVQRDSAGEHLADPGRSCIIDLAGDLWSGRILAADRDQVRLELAAAGTTLLAWKDIRLLRTAQVESEPLRWEGEIGEIEFDGGGLMVALLEADEKRWVVEHPLLGRRELPAGSVRSWTPRVVGVRQTLRSTPFHLGEKFAYGFSRPLPDGTSLRLGATLDDASPFSGAEVDLVLDAVGLEGVGPLAPFAARIRSGHLRTSVWVNGRPVDYLNRLVEDRSSEPVPLRLPLGARALRPGTNTIEIQQSPDPETGFFDEMELANVALEYRLSPEPREQAR